MQKDRKMKEDIKMADDIKKVPDELKDEELDLVAGGIYTKEEWDAMTPAERNAAQVNSIKLCQVGKKSECKLIN